MFITKALSIFALASLVTSNDVIVGLKTDGTKFFDEGRQANPALWRQMDNVTIEAPENEVISRIVITDLRPDKDGDVKIVEGGEGQKNVTIELKSPTVLRGYEFHIEVFSVPEGQIPVVNDELGTTESVQSEATKITDQTNIPDLSTDKNVPAIITKDEEVKDSDRQGRNAHNEDISTAGTTEFTSTTLKGDVTTAATTTQYKESVTNESSFKSSDVPNTFAQESTVPPIPLNRDFNINPSNPVVTGRDTKDNSRGVTRHERDTEVVKEGNLKNLKFDLTPTNTHLLEASTETDKEASSTVTSDIKPVEERTEDNDELIAPKVHTFESRKFTSFIPSKSEHSTSPVKANDDDKTRNARDAEDMTEITSTTTESGESTTANSENAETTTLVNEECVTETTESNEHSDTNPNIPQNTAKENGGMIGEPVYINNRQRFHNPRFQSRDDSLQKDQKSTDDLNPNPEVLREQLTIPANNEPKIVENKPYPNLM